MRSGDVLLPTALLNDVESDCDEADASLLQAVATDPSSSVGLLPAAVSPTCDDGPRTFAETLNWCPTGINNLDE